MVTPTTGALAAHAPAPDLEALGAALRAIYTQAFEQTRQAATSAGRRFEAADGSGAIDPIHAADAAGCRAVNARLKAAIAEHLSGASLIERIDEPAVIDSRWISGDRTIAIEWDHELDFGDPEALVVQEVTR